MNSGISRQVVSGLEKIVGGNELATDEATLSKYSRDVSYPLSSESRPACVVWPKDLDGVQKIVKLANGNRIRVTPRSSPSGLHGLSLASPGGIVVDLTKMKGVAKIDSVNLYATIQTGVNFEQLQKQVQEKGMRVTPALRDPLASVVSSYLGGFPLLCAAKLEYNAPVINLEAVLPDGEVFRTGSGSLSGDISGPHGASPLGPILDFYRMFHGACGTLGIVTAASVKLKYLPSVSKGVFSTFERLNDAVELTYKIQRREVGVECLLVNNLSLALFSTDRFDQMLNLAKGFPAWSLMLCLAGGQRRAEEKIEYEEKVLAEISRSAGFKFESSINQLDDIAKSFLEEIYFPRRLGGRHNVGGLCGDIGFYTTLERAPIFHDAICSLAAKSGFPVERMGVILLPVERGRAVYCEYDLYFTAEELLNGRRIIQIFSTLGERIIEMGGYIPIPYGPLQAGFYSRLQGVYVSLVRDLKKKFDPNNIMNPGKLAF